MGKPNYSFQKRQREIAKQKKKEAKRLAKLAKKNSGDEDIENMDELDGEAVDLEDDDIDDDGETDDGAETDDD